MLVRVSAAAFALALIAQASFAQTIYPIDRAAILQGARFDFKVEFPKIVDPKDVRIMVNGTDYAQVFGQAAQFVEKEDGAEASSFVLRGLSIAKAGSYEI